MELGLTDPETDSLARQVARLTGETPAEAVRGALRDRLRREQLKRGKAPNRSDEINAIVKRVAASPVLDDRTADEMLGYDERTGCHPGGDR